MAELRLLEQSLDPISGAGGGNSSSLFPPGILCFCFQPIFHFSRSTFPSCSSPRRPGLLSRDLLWDPPAQRKSAVKWCPRRCWVLPSAPCSGGTNPPGTKLGTKGGTATAALLVEMQGAVKLLEKRNAARPGGDAGTELWAAPALTWAFTAPFKPSGGNN